MVFSNSKFKKNISFNRALAYITTFTFLNLVTNSYAGDPGTPNVKFNKGIEDTLITTQDDTLPKPKELDTDGLNVPDVALQDSSIVDTTDYTPKVAPDLIVKLTKPDTSSALPDSTIIVPNQVVAPDSTSISPDTCYVPKKLKTGGLTTPSKITKPVTKPDTTLASPNAPVGRAPNINLTLSRPTKTDTVYSTKTDTVETLVDKYHPFSLVVGANGSLGRDLEQLVAGFSVGNGRLNLGLEVGYPVNGGNTTDEIIKSDFEIQGPYKSQKITQKRTENKVYDIGAFIKKSIGNGFNIGFGSGISREDKKGNTQERVPLLYTDGRPVLDNNGNPIVGKDGDSYSSENYNGKFDFRLGYEKGNIGIQAVLGIKGKNLKPYAGARVNFNVSSNTKTRRNKK